MLYVRKLTPRELGAARSFFVREWFRGDDSPLQACPYSLLAGPDRARSNAGKHGQTTYFTDVSRSLAARGPWMRSPSVLFVPTPSSAAMGLAREFCDSVANAPTDANGAWRCSLSFGHVYSLGCGDVARHG